MNSQAQNILTVVASSFICGAVGFWLVPSQSKVAVAGGLAGAVGALSHVQQNKRIRSLEAQQKRSLPTDHNSTSIDELKNLIYKNQKNINVIANNARKYQDKAIEIEKAIRLQTGQSKLNQNEINQLRNHLKKLDSQVAVNGVDQSSKTQSNDQQIEARLSALEDLLRSGNLGTNHQSLNSPTTAQKIEDSDQDNFIVDENTQEIFQWFNHRQVDVESYYEPDKKVDDLLDGLSLYLGDNYNVLSKFHWRLRNSVGRRAHFSLETVSPQEKSIHNQFLKKLRSCDYLSLGRIVKGNNSQDYIIATSHERADIQGFLDGGWFERFVYYKIEELLNAEVVEYQAIRNPKIIYRSNENAELDLFFIIDGKPLLIECKAGQNFDIKRFVSHRERLALQPNQALLVVLNLDEAEAHLRAKNWKICVANQHTFLEAVRDFIPTEDEGREPSTSEDALVDNGDVDIRDESAPIEDADDENLENFFKKRKLNLAPEHRHSVLLALSQFFETTNKPIVFNQLAKRIRDDVQDRDIVISRGKVNEILNCLRYAKYFLDKDKKPVLGISQPIHSLFSTDPKDLEQACLQFYANKITELLDPDFLKIPDNLTEFERLTQGQLLSIHLS